MFCCVRQYLVWKAYPRAEPITVSVMTTIKTYSIVMLELLIWWKKEVNMHCPQQPPTIISKLQMYIYLNESCLQCASYVTEVLVHSLCKPVAWTIKIHSIPDCHMKASQSVLIDPIYWMLAWKNWSVSCPTPPDNFLIKQITTYQKKNGSYCFL